MELYQLGAFIEVSRHRNLTRAAEHLNISPSALSSQIKSLEEELDVALFIRSSKGMSLTGQGREILAHARSVVKAASRLRKRAREMGRKRPEVLRIGMNSDPGFLKMSGLDEALAETLPDTAIRYINSSTLETARMLRGKIIHIGFIFGDFIAKDVTVEPLARVDINVVIPIALLDDGHDPDWDDIARMPWIWGEERCPSHCMFQELINKRGLEINKAGYALDEEITKQLVMDGKGVALVRCDEARKLEESGRAHIWEQGTVTVAFGLAYLSDRKTSMFIKQALAAIRRVWDRETGPKSGDG